MLSTAAVARSDNEREDDQVADAIGISPARVIEQEITEYQDRQINKKRVPAAVRCKAARRAKRPDESPTGCEWMRPEGRCAASLSG